MLRFIAIYSLLFRRFFKFSIRASGCVLAPKPPWQGVKLVHAHCTMAVVFLYVAFLMCIDLRNVDVVIHSKTTSLTCASLHC